MYQELADKEQALILAAQFGKNLIDEKEDLEKQIELIKREQQNQIEVNFNQNYLFQGCLLPLPHYQKNYCKSSRTVISSKV